MTRDVKSTIGKIAACLAVVLMVAVASVVMRPPAPLTTFEKRLVGNWAEVDQPGDDLGCDMSFTADRAFHSNDGQFAGRWSINNGRLHIKYWNDDWREFWREWRLLRLWNALRWSDEITRNIRFTDDDHRVELSKPGSQPSEALIRSP